MIKIIFFALAIICFNTSCVLYSSFNFKKSDPVAVGTNDTLYYFYLDLEEMPGELRAIGIQRIHQTKLMDAVYDITINKNKKHVVGFVHIAPQTAAYLSSLSSVISGIPLLTEDKGVTSYFNMQDSPLKFKAGNIKDIHYSGRFKYKKMETGFFETPKFKFEECTDADKITETEIIRHILGMAKNNDLGETLRNGDWIPLLEKKLRTISKK